jgi:rhamnosyltransferase
LKTPINKLPKVAVLLAAYNGSRWINEQIESILAQKNVEIYLFVSVDLSSDSTLSIVKGLARKFQRILIYEQKKRLGGAALNFYYLFGIVNVENFDYIALSDQDDIWTSGKIFRAIKLLRAFQKDGYSSNVFAFWPNGRIIKIIKSQLQKRWDFLFESAGPGCTFVVCKHLAVDIRSSIINNQLNINKILLHDWFIYAFSRGNGYEWIIDKKATMFYRQHNHNEIGVNMGFKAKLFRAIRILNGSGFEQSCLIAKCIGLTNHPFASKKFGFTRADYIRIAFNAHKCRRSFLGTIYLISACLFYSLFNWPNKNG